jgi:hypothetical protein
MELHAIVDRLRSEHRELLAGFATSSELARLPPHPQRLIWSAALLETMQQCELCWAEIDLYTLRGLLYGAMSWVIDAPPEDPAAVARELAALVRHVADREEVMDARACCAYLMSDRAAPDIAAWIAPMERGLPPVPRQLADVGSTG